MTGTPDWRGVRKLAIIRGLARIASAPRAVRNARGSAQILGGEDDRLIADKTHLYMALVVAPDAMLHAQHLTALRRRA